LKQVTVNRIPNAPALLLLHDLYTATPENAAVQRNGSSKLLDGDTKQYAAVLIATTKNFRMRRADAGFCFL
jgi:hypothetical protein